MRSFLLSLTSWWMALTVPAIALADAPKPFYFGFGAGITLPQNADVDFDEVSAGQIDYHSGFSFGGTLGYNIPKYPIRLESEIFLMENGVERLNLTQTPGDINDTSRSVSVMGNILFDFDHASGLSPYFGAGIGMSNVMSKKVDSVFAYQGLAGVSYKMENGASWYTGYRYFDTDTPKLKFADVLAAIPYNRHDIRIGFRVPFGRDLVQSSYEDEKAVNIDSLQRYHTSSYYKAPEALPGPVEELYAPYREIPEFDISHQALQRKKAQDTITQAMGIEKTQEAVPQVAPEEAKPAADMVAKAQAKARITAKAKAQSGYIVQIGLYSHVRNAKRAQSRLVRHGKAHVEQVRLRGKTLHKVTMGPFEDERVAKATRDSIAQMGGFADVFVVRP